MSDHDIIDEDFADLGEVSKKTEGQPGDPSEQILPARQQGG